MLGTATALPLGDSRHSRVPYPWLPLSNTTLGVLMATTNSSIVLISLPAIFRGIHLDPLAPGNVSYLLWMLMGYLLVTAVLVMTLGRLGDMYGRVRIYNTGFAVFAAASVALALCPLDKGGGALWIIGFRLVQGVGGAMLMANSTAILTDAFPAERRGMALGINQVAGIAGSFLGLVIGGLLSEWHWRAVFWVSVPLGIIGTVWAYASLRETSQRRAGRIDWWGNVTFAAGLTALLAGITYGIQPYGGHSEGWTNPGFWAVSAAAPSCSRRSSRSRAASTTPCSTSGCSGSGRCGRGRRGCCCRRSRAVACSSCSSSGCRASGCRCTATAMSRRRCGPASTCCR